MEHHDQRQTCARTTLVIVLCFSVAAAAGALDLVLGYGARLALSTTSIVGFTLTSVLSLRFVRLYRATTADAIQLALLYGAALVLLVAATVAGGSST